MITTRQSQVDFVSGWPIPTGFPNTTMLSLSDFTYISKYFLPPGMPFFHAVGIIISITTALPLIQRHRLQNQHALRRTPNTSWFNSLSNIVSSSLLDPSAYPLRGLRQAIGPNNEERTKILDHLEEIAEMVCDPEAEDTPLFDPLAFVNQHIVLVSAETKCLFCVTEDNRPSVLVRHGDQGIVTVNIITRANTLAQGSLLISRCPKCKADYYPDSITRVSPDGGGRRKFFLYKTEYLHISKPAKLWAHRSLAIAQAEAIRQHTTILGFSRWYNATYGAVKHNAPKISHRQSHRLFVEHMVRILGEAHPNHPHLSTRNQPTTRDVVEAANAAFVQGGILPGALDHTCSECTHPKRYREHANAMPEAGAFGVAGVDDDPGVEHLPIVSYRRHL